MCSAVNAVLYLDYFVIINCHLYQLRINISWCNLFLFFTASYDITSIYETYISTLDLLQLVIKYRLLDSMAMNDTLNNTTAMFKLTIDKLNESIVNQQSLNCSYKMKHWLPQ